MGKVISDPLRQLNLDFDKSHCDHVSLIMLDVVIISFYIALTVYLPIAD